MAGLLVFGTCLVAGCNDDLSGTWRLESAPSELIAAGQLTIEDGQGSAELDTNAGDDVPYDTFCDVVVTDLDDSYNLDFDCAGFEPNLDGDCEVSDDALLCKLPADFTSRWKRVE